MATLPSSSATVQTTAGANGSGTDLCCVFSPCPQGADMMPVQYGNAAAIYADKGYSEGLEYAAYHFDQVKKPVVFVPLPISTVGVVGRVNTSGNTGSSVASVAAGGSGVLGEHVGIVKVKSVNGSTSATGTIGTDQFLLSLSLDGGRNYIDVNLSTNTSFTPLYYGVTVSFAAGTLTAGDTVITWFGSAPLSNSASWTTARQNLANQLKFFRTVLLIGDLLTANDATNFLAQMNTYKSANERNVFGRACVSDRSPLAALSNISNVMTGQPSLTFASAGETCTRAAGSWITDGFVVGDTVTPAGTASNNTPFVITALTATVMTASAATFVNETIATATVTARPTLVFAASGHTVTRNRGSWLADGFNVGDTPTFAGTASNNALALPITALTGLVMTFGSGVVNETVATNVATVTKGQTLTQWMTAANTTYAGVDASPRIAISAGRGRPGPSPFSGWNHRRPESWAESLREYQHDLHIATLRKSDGPTGWDLTDTNGNTVEWDDRAQGGAGIAARFCVFRTWGNGPTGTFCAVSLTRDSSGSVLALANNMAVTNLACQVVQSSTENAFVGVSEILNPDGTATTDSLSTGQKQVNDDLELNLLGNATGEGPRCSSAVWTPATTDVLSVPDATINGTLALNLNGTVLHVQTVAKVK